MDSTEYAATFSFNVLVALHRCGWPNEADFRNEMSKFGVLVIWDEIAI